MKSRVLLLFALSVILGAPVQSQPDAPKDKSDLCPGGKLTAPKPMVTPDPQRPKNFQPGVVVVSCVIGVDGRAQNAKIAKSLTPEADANALEVIKKWEFKPAACNGEPIPVKVKVEVAFR